MDAARSLEIGPPPLPATHPGSPRVPGLPTALVLLLLYFVLQWTVSAVIALFIGLGVGLRNGIAYHAATAAQMGQHVRSVLTQPDARTAMAAATLSIAALTTLWAVRRRWPLLWNQSSAWRGFGFARPSHAGFYVAAVAIGIGTPICGGLLTQWLAHGHAVPQDIAQLGHSASMPGRIVLALVAVTLGPLVEEALFRGVLLFALLRPLRRTASTSTTALAARIRWQTMGAVLVSALVFGTVHLPDLGFLWYAVPNLALLGVGLAWLRLSSRSLWPSVLAHGLNNALAVISWFIVVHPPG